MMKRCLTYAVLSLVIGCGTEHAEHGEETPAAPMRDAGTQPTPDSQIPTDSDGSREPGEGDAGRSPQSVTCRDGEALCNGACLREAGEVQGACTLLVSERVISLRPTGTELLYGTYDGELKAVRLDGHQVRTIAAVSRPWSHRRSRT
jgi:hypothetical protein